MYPYPQSLNTSLRSTMTSNDFVIAAESPEVLKLLGSMGSYNLDWPDTVVHNNKVYKFKTQESMPGYAAGNYHGCACYEHAPSHYQPK